MKQARNTVFNFQKPPNDSFLFFSYTDQGRFHFESFLKSTPKRSNMPLAKTTSVNITFQEGHAEVIVEEISNPEVFSFEVSPGSSAQVAFKGDEKECSVVKVHFMLSDSPIEIGWTNLPEVFMEGLFVHYMTRKLA